MIYLRWYSSTCTSLHRCSKNLVLTKCRDLALNRGALYAVDGVMRYMYYFTSQVAYKSTPPPWSSAPSPSKAPLSDVVVVEHLHDLAHSHVDLVGGVAAPRASSGLVWAGRTYSCAAREACL